MVMEGCGPVSTLFFFPPNWDRGVCVVCGSDGCRML